MRLRFHQRWQLTIIQVCLQSLVALVTHPTGLTVAIALLFIGGCALLDVRLSAGRLLDLERTRWLANLPRTSNGDAFVTRSDFKKYCPPTSTDGGSA